jgi:hypothetical protein
MTFEARAQSILLSPETYEALGDWSDWRVVLRIWRFSALSLRTCWALARRNDAFQLRRLQWNPSADVLAPSELAGPTIFGSEATVPSDPAGEILRTLAAVELAPFAQQEGIILDGTEFGVERSGSRLSTRVTWHSASTDSHRQLTDWFERTANYFDRLLPLSTASLR